MRHGASAYRNGFCRCSTCTDDATARAGRERAARTARLAADPSLAPHGNVHTYKNWGCRCEPCIRAHSADLKVRRARRVASHG